MKLAIPSVKPPEEAREHALSLLNEAVSAARAQLSPTPDQADVYRAKYEAAKRVERFGDTEPYVESYAALEGISAEDAATEIILAHYADQDKHVRIEAARLKAKRAIMNAESTSAVYAALRMAKVEL